MPLREDGRQARLSPRLTAKTETLQGARVERGRANRTDAQAVLAERWWKRISSDGYGRP